MARHPLPLGPGLRAPLTGAVFVCGALLGCNGNEPPAQVATTVAVTPASVDLHAIGAVRQVSAAVLDQKGDTIRNAKIVWTSLGASVASVDSTGKITAVAAGSAQIKAAASTNASVATLVPVTVTQVAAHLVKVSGDVQTAVVGSSLPLPLTVRVIDSANVAVADAIVAFTVTQGGGSVTAADTTAGDGLAFATLQLGSATGVNAVSASVMGTAIPPVTFTATATAAPPTSMTIQAGDAQTAHVGTAVAIPPAVLLQDSFNNPTAGVVVTFAVVSGGGVVTKPVDTTGANGIAAPTAWTLGSAGTNTLNASVSLGGVSGNPVTFTATGTAAGAPTQVLVDTGNGQTGLAGYALNVRPAVRVLDAANGPVSGVQVDFAVTGGGGSVAGPTATTDLFGVARVGSWTVQLGGNSLSATVTGSGIAGNPASFSAIGVTSLYNITLQYLNAVSPARKAVFDSAAARWQRLIFGDVPDIVIPAGDSIPPGTCGSNSPTIKGTIDDIIIFVTLDSIDGPGKILGQSGPCYVRIPGFLPLVGIMHFDTADVASLENSGRFTEVILHEMAHVLGYGTIWDSNGLGLLVGATASGGTDPHFIGAQGTQAFNDSGGANYSAGAKVPVENCVGFPPGTCGAGTYDGHWRETVFDNELMTGFINPGVNPLSVITTAAMGDEGYLVNYAASDPYTVVNALAARAPRAGAIELKDDIMHLPIYTVDAGGRLIGVVRPR
jgi:hypothetical protein